MGRTPDKGDHASIAEITTRIQNYKIQRGWRFQDVHNPKKWNDMFRRNFSDDAIGQEMNGYSAQEEFKNHVLINGIPHPGIPFELVSKPPGSRETGFALVRERLMNTAARPDSKIREGKGLFIVKEHCPTLPARCRSCHATRRNLMTLTRPAKVTSTMRSAMRSPPTARRTSEATACLNQRPYVGSLPTSAGVKCGDAAQFITRKRTINKSSSNSRFEFKLALGRRHF